jgi:hypothetical protein
MREELEIVSAKDLFPCSRCPLIKRTFCFMSCKEYGIVVEAIANNYQLRPYKESKDERPRNVSA